MPKEIVFTSIFGFPEIEKPKPAMAYIPDWYKNTDSYIDGKKVPTGNGELSATIKKCMPVFDCITAGYIITSPADVYVSIKDEKQWFEWSNFNLISFHPIEQAPNHPARKPHQYPKWINPWSIKTPKGYSTLFVQPFHRESIFTILPGIVDTDTYTAPVNFPMVINDPNFEGFIPKGTPIAQVIPFKRDAWKLRFGGEQELIEQANVLTKLQTKFFDRYKTMFRSKKEFR
jgi:hypothetical protein